MATITMSSEVNYLIDYFDFKNCKVTVDPNIKVPTLVTNDGKKINGLATISKYLVENSSLNNGLLGQSLEDQANISQWLEFRTSDLEYAIVTSNFQIVLKELDSYIEDRVYFVANRFSLADLILFFGLRQIFMVLNFKEKETYVNLSRWFNLVQNDERIMKYFPKIIFSKTRLY